MKLFILNILLFAVMVWLCVEFPQVKTQWAWALPIGIMCELITIWTFAPISKLAADIVQQNNIGTRLLIDVFAINSLYIIYTYSGCWFAPKQLGCIC